MAVEASIVVSFAEGVDRDVVVVEFDPDWESNQDSEGNLKSTFDSGPPPDSPVFLIHHGATLVVGSIVATEGTVSGNLAPSAGITQSRSDDVTFAKIGDTSGITYANAKNESVEWVGNLSGSVAVVDTDLKLIAGGPCTGEATFDVVFQEQRMLTPPNPIPFDDEGNYEITIFITMVGA